MVSYQIETDLMVEEFKNVLLKSTLGERRPIDDTESLTQMLANANLILTARIDTKLVGIARSFTDYHFCTYLSDLAVDQDYQKMGIGKELLRQTKLASPKAKLILLAAPKAVNYYPKIGMTQWEHCYILDDVNDLM